VVFFCQPAKGKQVAAKCPNYHFDNPADTVYCGKCGTKFDSAGPVSFTEILDIPTGEMTRGTLFDGRYEIIEELDTGGMGKVYRAFDRRIKEELAIKALRPEIATDKRTLERERNSFSVAPAA
jgi:serine/threonine-protein kinase